MLKTIQTMNLLYYTCFELRVSNLNNNNGIGYYVPTGRPAPSWSTIMSSVIPIPYARLR